MKRFWSKVDMSGGPDACWPWLAHCNGDGYGMIKIAGKAERSHRVALMLSGVFVGHGVSVLHACDNPPCCNPKHLRTGTQADNNADMVARGRNSTARGERNANAKLDWGKVAEIRQLGKTMTATAIAPMYGVSQVMISNILANRSWRIN